MSTKWNANNFIDDEASESNGNNISDDDMSSLNDFIVDDNDDDIEFDYDNNILNDINDSTNDNEISDEIDEENDYEINEIMLEMKDNVKAISNDNDNNNEMNNNNERNLDDKIDSLVKELNIKDNKDNKQLRFYEQLSSQNVTVNVDSTDSSDSVSESEMEMEMDSNDKKKEIINEEIKEIEININTDNIETDSGFLETKTKMNGILNDVIKDLELEITNMDDKIKECNVDFKVIDEMEIKLDKKWKNNVDIHKLFNFIDNYDDNIIENEDNLLPNKKIKLNKNDNTLNNSILNLKNKNNKFISHEIKLANETMKHAITKRINLEHKRVAPPLSNRDIRLQKSKPDNAGKLWFNMSKGELTPENKAHFLMTKYRHLLYREWKPPRSKETDIPKYFEIGKIIEGPTQYYSSRINKKDRKNSWIEEFMSNNDTKSWLDIRTERALKNINKTTNKYKFINTPFQSKWKRIKQSRKIKSAKLRRKWNKKRKI